MKFLAQIFFEKGPTDKFKAIDTLYGSLAQLFTFVNAKNKKSLIFKKNAFS
jgi:hypothetical protein